MRGNKTRAPNNAASYDADCSVSMWSADSKGEDQHREGKMQIEGVTGEPLTTDQYDGTIPQFWRS